MFEEIVESGIIEPEHLAELLDGENAEKVKLLDASFVLPTSSENPHANYISERIADATFFDICNICDPLNPVPHMLCSPDSFAGNVSRMGISNDDLVVIYGQSGMIMGPARAWWMFRTFGHENVCVLNGGLPAWKNAKLPLNTQKPPSEIPHMDFKATKNENLVINMQSLLESLDNIDCSIFDARPAERFNGTSPEPRPGMRAGHIPGSENIPCSLLVEGKTGKLKSKEEIKNIFISKNFNSANKTYLSCGSGVTACFLALSLFYIGYKNACVYDGSWSEWGHSDSGAPVNTAQS